MITVRWSIAMLLLLGTGLICAIVALIAGYLHGLAVRAEEYDDLSVHHGVQVARADNLQQELERANDALQKARDEIKALEMRTIEMPSPIPPRPPRPPRLPKGGA